MPSRDLFEAVSDSSCSRVTVPTNLRCLPSEKQMKLGTLVTTNFENLLGTRKNRKLPCPLYFQASSYSSTSVTQCCRLCRKNGWITLRYFRKTATPRVIQESNFSATMLKYHRNKQVLCFSSSFTCVYAIVNRGMRNAPFSKTVERMCRKRRKMSLFVDAGVCSKSHNLSALLFEQKDGFLVQRDKT